MTPAAGLVRALDVVLPEYQSSQDFLGVWDSSTGQSRPGFPGIMNDLQFLTGPSVGNIDATPTEEVVSASASMDLAAFNAAGTPPGPSWPKLSTDWTVANPLIGSFGTLDTQAGANKVVVGLTRSGYINAYETTGGACTPSSWPRFHHDNANSGNYSRDAVLPGKPMNATLSGTPPVNIELDAPGDDLLCGTAAEYEIVTSNNPIDESNFDQATPLEGAPDPTAPGAHQSFPIPEGALRYVGLRAVDEQENVGRVVGFDRGAPPPLDQDGDGDPDGTDNCISDFNPDQSDIDGDGIGDACDPDRDGDGIADGTDNCRDTVNPDQLDFDGDGLGNVCDPDPGSAPTTPTPAAPPSGGSTTTPSGRCATVKSGTAGKDSLTGTAGGDQIAGLRGGDLISGLAGDDCLFGNKGGDRISGGDGADQISGGNSRDRVNGGRGGDTIRSGNAGDVVKARDGEADTVDCGGGEDRASADAADNLQDCERVRRR
jgi:hypothetical protein